MARNGGQRLRGLCSDSFYPVNMYVDIKRGYEPVRGKGDSTRDPQEIVEDRIMSQRMQA